jgi:IS6 family transposase
MSRETRSHRRWASGFAWFRFPPDVIAVALRWYLRHGLSYRDVEELLAERGVVVDHVSVCRWVRRFTPLFIDATGPAGARAGTEGPSMRPTSRFVVAGVTCIGPSTSSARSSTSCFHPLEMRCRQPVFARMLAQAPRPAEVTTDRAPVYLRVLDGVVPDACRVVERYASDWAPR